MIDFFLVYIYVDDCFFVNMKFSEFKNDYKLYYILRSLFFSDILFYVLSWSVVDVWIVKMNIKKKWEIKLVYYVF